jgi:glutamate-ammonia-ligase adenylyltransferase
MSQTLPESLASEISEVTDLSPFFQDLLQDDSLPLAGSLADIDVAHERDALFKRYESCLAAEPDLDLSVRLRKLRRSEMARIVFRDLTRRASTLETTAELSHLADFCIQSALDHCYVEALQRFGQPQAPDGEPEKLVVLGMGKLGAYELNLSSDIDLIFFYANQGQINEDGSKPVSHQEFFLWLARKTIACLDSSNTVHTVFRVDMRLRPYGDSGPLVLHRAAMEKYYVEQGRDWERYAFIKARVVAGDDIEGKDFLEWMKPFIFRRTLDYSAIQSLREMKGLIARQVELKEMSHDLKLGPGGIREIEFIAQAHQLIWGGRHPELQDSRVTVILKRLAEFEFMPADDVEDLLESYYFLRNCEHVLQAEMDRQTHLLPTDEISKSRLARAMGEPDYESFLERLDARRSRVSSCFDLVVRGSVPSEAEPIDARWYDAWQKADGPDLFSLRSDIGKMNLNEDVLGAIDLVMPRLLQHCIETEAPELARTRMLPVIRAILRRSTYLVFLNENTEALHRAVQLVAISPWIAEQLSTYPILLYELTDRAIREVAVSKKQLEAELREVMRSVDAGDLEMQMDALRQFKLGATLKIAAMELKDQLSIMQASDGLTALAEVILEQSLDMAWHYLEQRHGSPCDADGQPIEERIAIVGYGKAGGLELAYGSDLDLVFLCPAYIMGNTDGASSINNNVFYVRAGQRIIHILTSFTRFGILYSADLRLRPQGNKGPLVATISAFERYQDSEAWTWEHQAIIRARFIAGDRVIGGVFTTVRERILRTERDRDALLDDVLSMREKMREHLSGASSGNNDASDVLGRFDLKHDAGAIVDIEFMVQYAVLAWASETPALSRWTDVMRLLDELGDAGIFTEADADALQRAYLTFRAAVHHGWLGLETDYDRLQGYRNEVHRIWQEKMRAR